MGRELVRIDKINYRIYKEFKSNVEVYCPTYNYWCSNILPLGSGMYMAYYDYTNNYNIVSEEELFMYVPEYLLELFTDLKVYGNRGNCNRV